MYIYIQILYVKKKLKLPYLQGFHPFSYEFIPKKYRTKSFRIILLYCLFGIDIFGECFYP